MERDKQQRLKNAGWRIGDAAEFLELSAEEAEYVELKLALSSTFASAIAGPKPKRGRRATSRSNTR